MARTHLNRERIAQAALEFIDEHGSISLSMRKLGTYLGVEAMAIYRHVEGREALLDCVLQQLMSGVVDGLDEALGQSWQGYLQDIAHRIREVAIRHPKAFPLVVTQHPAAPWIRPPIRDLDLIEHLLRTLREHGLPDDVVVDVYQSFSSFLMGHLLLEAMHAGADPTAPATAIREEEVPTSSPSERINLDTHPTVQELSGLLQRNTSEEQFEIGLEAMIDRIEANLRS
jgi:TetR/AcrR family transcriptional regulator, tetracycline repressor protein